MNEFAAVYEQLTKLRLDLNQFVDRLGSGGRGHDLVMTSARAAHIQWDWKAFEL